MAGSEGIVTRCKSSEMHEMSMRIRCRFTWILGWIDVDEAGVSQGRLAVTGGGRKWPQLVVGIVRVRGIGERERDKEEKEMGEKKEKEGENI